MPSNSENNPWQNSIEIIGDFEGESNLFHEIVKGIRDSEVVQVSKSFFARKEQEFDIGHSRSYLPLSGHSLRVKQKGSGTFSIRSIPSSSATTFEDYSKPARKIDIESGEIVKAYFDVLRLSQLALYAHTARVGFEDERGDLPLPIYLKDALECLESFLDQRSDDDEINQLREHLISYHKMWYDLFNASIEEEGLITLQQKSKTLHQKNTNFNFVNYQTIVN